MSFFAVNHLWEGKMKKKVGAKPVSGFPSWTFLTNHAHVLICLSRDADMVLREVASQVGITERAVQRIIAELEEEGYLTRLKEGRRNTYQLNLNKALRHPVEKGCNVSHLVKALV
jgi:DNA-binding MarR family transcriptional regulator